MSDSKTRNLERAAASDPQAKAALDAAQRRADPREQAIARLVEQDVARWGEGEREASRRSHASKSLGMALLELANRAELDGAPSAEVKALRRDAKAAASTITADERRGMRESG